MVEGCPSPYPTKEPKHKVLADAQECVFNRPIKRVKQASTSQILIPRPPPGFAARNRLPPPPGFNLHARNGQTFGMKSGTSPLFQGSQGFRQNLSCSSKQNSTKVVVQFAQTLPYCHLKIWPSLTPFIQLLLLFFLTIHGLWGIEDDKNAPHPNLPTDDKFIKEEVAAYLYDRWPSLKDHSTDGAQRFWNHEWERHGRKLGLFQNKEEYLREGLRLHYKYDLSWKLSIAVALLRSVSSRDLLETTYNSVRWFGVRASRLHRMLRSAIGDGIVIKCERDADNYLLLDEIILLFEYDTRSMTREVVSYHAYPRFRRCWRYKNAFQNSDIIWFVTKESNKQVQNQAQR